MAFKTQNNATLTDTQSELTSKIGAMKSLLSIPLLKRINIPKNQQISTFDYLVRVLKSIGVNPEILFQVFINKVFDESSNFLEDKVIDAVGAALDKKGIKLSPTTSNTDVIRSAVPDAFLSTVKMKIAKELTLMIFGPKDGKSAETLVNDPYRRGELLGEAVCGYNMFTLTNNPSIRNEDIEFNRVKLKQQLEKGEVILEINCQDVKIKLPEDPGYIFGEGGSQTIPSRQVTPAQSMSLLVQYVGNRTQQINNEQNSNQAGVSFFQILIEKLLSYITTLVFPYLGPIFSFLKTRPETANFNPNNTLYGSCAINSNNTPETTAFSSSLMNALLKELLSGMLLFALKEFKKMISAYFARTALERLKRKADKIKLKFKILKEKTENTAATKIQRFNSALSSLDNILK